MPSLSGISAPEILDRLPAGFASFSDDGVILGCNRTLFLMLGYEQSELIGTPFERLLSVPSRIFYQTHVFPLLKMQNRIEEVYLTVQSKAGEILPTLINGTRMERSEGPVNECLIVPIRRRNDYEDQILAAKRQAEEAIEAKDRIHEALELAHSELGRHQQVVTDRNLELEALRGSLEAQVEAQTADLRKMVKDLEGFNYSIAHDLRTPLRAILSTSSILLTDAADSLTPEHKRLLERQQQNATKLANLVQDLLDFSRLGLKEIVLRKLDMSQLAHKVAQTVLAEYPRSKVQVEVQEGLEALGDRAMVQVVLQNLFDNAVKYSPAGGNVTFGAEGDVFYMRDQGIGLDPAYAEQIFRPFERLHRDEDFPGTGIGLANVRRIIERHGGKVWLESAPGAGTTFYFTLG